MKNKFLYITSFLLVFIITSCGEEFLEILPADQSTVDGFYQNEAQIKTATGTLYSRPWFGYNDKFSWAAGDGMAGDLYNDYQDEGQLFFFAFSSTNGIISQAWEGLFNVISIANNIITDVPRVAGANGVSETAINAGLGEARFMRGYAYYVLAEYWGDVPVVESNAEIIAGGNLDLPKNTRKSIYEFIKRDLEFAAEHLPDENKNDGRVTSWSAKGLLAKLHLTMGHALKSDADFQKAKEYAQDVIENSGYDLMDNYADLFKIANNNNSESLFALQWSNGTWGVGNSRQAVMGRNSLVTGNDEAWGGGKSVTYSFMQNVTNNSKGKTDLRRREIYMQLGDHYPEIDKAGGGYTYNIVTPDPDGGNDIEYKAPLLNNVKKYIVGHSADVGVPINNQGVPLNQYMLRLADVYLIYAEAAIGSGSSTNDAKAIEYYNEIRDRAGLDPLSGSTLTFEDVFNERRVEFGIEGINWFDIKRRYYRNSSEAISYVNAQNRGTTYEQIEGYDGDRNMWDAYELEPDDTPVSVTGDDFFLPIPNTEVAQNPLFGKDVEAVDWVPGE